MRHDKATGEPPVRVDLRIRLICSFLCNNYSGKKIDFFMINTYNSRQAPSISSTRDVLNNWIYP